MRVRLAFTLTILTVGAGMAGLALADDDVIATRQAIMQNNQDAVKLSFDMALGKQPYDASKAAIAMKSIQEEMVVFPTLFPEGSDQGDTSASPAVWENMDDFKGRVEKLIADAKAAEAATTGGLDAFKVALGAVAENCGACHDLYRKKRK